MKILKSDRLQYVANINYLLCHIGSTEGILLNEIDHPIRKVDTKLGAINFWIPFPDYHTESLCFDYRLDGELHCLPAYDDPIFCLLKDQYNSKLNRFSFSYKEADLACLRSWEVAYESMARKLCHLIYEHISTAKAIAAKGTLEELLPSEGHVLMGQKKTTVAAFRKKYETALGNQGTLFFDRRIELDDVPYSPFKGQILTIVAK